MVKNIVDIVAGGVMFWIAGYGIAFGKNGNAFMGGGDFFFSPSNRKKSLWNLYDETYMYASWIFHYAFASTAITIVSGSVAGRMKMSGYIVWAFLAPFFYAFPVHWAWSDEGWLGEMGFHDFAGCGPVHLFGACGSLAGITLVGARIGRFDKHGKRGKDIKEIYEPDNVILGTLILWWGWIGFNCGSTFGITGISGAVAVRVGVCTMVATVAGAASEIFKIFFPTIPTNLGVRGRANARASRMSMFEGTPVNFVSLIGVEDNRIRIPELTNAILAALVSITASCNCVTPSSAVVIGLVAPSIASFANRKIEQLGLDDPCGAIGVHGACGIWGLLAVGLFKDNSLPGGQVGNDKNGFFFSGNLEQFGIQLLGALVIFFWGVCSSLFTFHCVKMRMGGTLRVKEEHELEGLDEADHGTSNMFSTIMAMARQESYKMGVMQSNVVNEETSFAHRRPSSPEPTRMSENNFTPKVFRNSFDEENPLTASQAGVEMAGTEETKANNENREIMWRESLRESIEAGTLPESKFLVEKLTSDMKWVKRVVVISKDQQFVRL